LSSLLGRESPAALKCALSALGLMRPSLRLPLVELDGAATREVSRAVAAVGERDLAA
jgi:4-hydroxy-tetrahydrodipicolinate synthase